MSDFQEESENLSTSLMNSAANDFTSSALVELGESFVDDFTDSIVKSDLATKIPVVSTIIAISKGILNFRDRRYVNKLLNFLAETSKASEEDKQKYRAKLDSNPDECKKAGETILDIIDKITDLERAKMIGKVFRAYMHEDNITTDDILTLSQMIERAYLSDLIFLSRKDEGAGGRWNDANLESVGIKKPMRVEDVNNAITNTMLKIKQEMPTLKENPVEIIYKTEIEESGLTDRGALLKRILRDY